MEKKLTQEEQILELFRANGGQFETKDIPYCLAFEYQRALWNLRARGYDIPGAERITNNNFRYRLLGVPDKPAHQAAPVPVKFGKDPQGEMELNVRPDYDKR